MCCRNTEMKSRISTGHFIKETVNITRHIAWLLHIGKSVFRLCKSSSWPHATRGAYIIFLLSLDVSIINHLDDIHVWSMSSTHLYTSWISIFSISLFFASDMNETTYSWQLTLSVTWCSSLHWSTWSQLIQMWFLFSVSCFIFIFLCTHFSRISFCIWSNELQMILCII